MIREPSTSFRTYVFFLLVVCVVTSIKLIRVWRAAPPFRLSRQASNPSYPQLLQASSASLKQWISFTFLGWGIFASISLYDVCDGLLDEKRIGSFVILFVIEDFSSAFSMALLVVLFLFLARWHMLRRIEHLRN